MPIAATLSSSGWPSDYPVGIVARTAHRCGRHGGCLTPGRGVSEIADGLTERWGEPGMRGQSTAHRLLDLVVVVVLIAAGLVAWARRLRPRSRRPRPPD